MLKALIPKEEKYFDDFREMITHIQQMAKYTEQLFADELIDKNHYLNIKPLELRCDEISSKIVKRLNKTFITPFDREDIFALTKRLDDISDMLLGAAARIETFNISKKVPHADKLASIIHKQVQELGIAIQDLKARRINETKAVKDGDSWVINGSKIYITNGQICDFVTIAAVTDKEKGSKGISTIVIDADTPGFSRSKMEKLGNHASATSEMYFDDCRVPLENLVGTEGDGFKYMLESLTGARISHSARSIGLAQVALKTTVEYANERKQFGKPIGKNQDIAFRLARISTEIEAARWLLYRVAWLYDQGDECRKEAAMTKLKSAEVAVKMAEEAMRIHAGAGYLAESVIQRYYRDAILYPITEGTSEIQQLIISRELGL